MTNPLNKAFREALGQSYLENDEIMNPAVVEQVHDPVIYVEESEYDNSDNGQEAQDIGSDSEVEIFSPGTSVSVSNNQDMRLIQVNGLRFAGDMRELKVVVDKLVERAHEGLSYSRKRRKYEQQVNMVKALKAQVRVLTLEMEEMPSWDLVGGGIRVERRRKRRRKNREQGRALEQFFEGDKNPAPAGMREVASKIGLEYQEVRQWFNNQRKKRKKEVMH